MKLRFALSLILATLALAAAGAEQTQTTTTACGPTAAELSLAGEVRTMLAGWEKRDPQPQKRYLHVVYWTPADTAPAPHYRERLTRVMKFVQAFYARQMESYGLGRRTINLQLEGNGLLRLPVVRGAQPFDHYRTESGQEVRQDCVKALREQGVDPDNETIVIFCNLSRWDPERKTIRQTSPYYASGTHRNGTAWQVDSPLLDSDQLGALEPMVTDGQYGRISLGKYNSIFVGGVVHELGHALGLPHCTETAEEKSVRGTALMGSGNRTMGQELRGEGRGTFLTLAHALKLASHPQFSGSVKEMMTPAKVSWSEWSAKAEGKSIIVGGRVSGEPRVYLVIGYADPEGHGDYHTTLGCAVPAADGRFRVAIPIPRDYKKAGEIRMVACCVNGAATGYAYHNAKPAFPFELRGGRADLSAMLERIEMDGALAKARGGRLSPQETAALQPKVREIIRRLLAADTAQGKPEPAAVSSATRAMVLSDCRPVSATTGWGGAHYDRLAYGGGPLVCEGKLFASGLYAHGPATYAYRVGEGWGRLSGTCGIADGYAGTVEFVVLGDGRELWRSKQAQAGKSEAFTVALKGVKKLELKTLLTRKGASGAWGLWLEPRLER